MSAERLFAVKEEMEKAEARRLQPYFVRSFFMKAFDALGGAMYPREAGPLRDHSCPGRYPRARPPHHRPQSSRARAVLKRYERVCFTKEAVRPLDRPGLAFAR